MKLHEYLEENGLTQAIFAARVGASQSSISKICAGAVFPQRALIRRIMDETGGAVTANDFIEMDVAS